ncbi:hypothetical protein L7F22_051966 [Adiantum nelumboides]|nr:hypothetical protein [Adiantum nelumboides]
MSMDGVSNSCLSLPVVSRPSDAAFRQAVSFQSHSQFINCLAGLRGFHLRSASHGMSCSHPAAFQNEVGVTFKKQEICKWRLSSYRHDESLDLESQILDFMDQSENPDLFPSRSQLLKAGRFDLVEAILAKGGWMVAGWDLEPDPEEQAPRLDSSSINDLTKVQRESEAVGELHNSETSLSGVDARKAERMGEGSGIVWPLKLYKANQGIPKRRPAGINGTFTQAQPGGILEGKMDFTCGSLAGNKGIEATSELTEKKKRRRRKSSKMSSASSNVQQRANGQQALGTQSESELIKFDDRQQNKENNMPISHRIRGLETELTSTLDVLKSERRGLTNDIKLKQKGSVHKPELEEVSDALEYCETEIINKRRELRTAQAQQTALEGKLALEFMEFRRTMEEKDKQLERAMQVLKTLRTARIVWPNPGREVFLAGSYDGWASWKRMEKSSAGVFVTTIQLYPGQYEIKFIVDGVWTVDSNRARAWENGFENNVLTIV